MRKSSTSLSGIELDFASLIKLREPLLICAGRDGDSNVAAIVIWEILKWCASDVYLSLNPPSYLDWIITEDMVSSIVLPEKGTWEGYALKLNLAKNLGKSETISGKLIENGLIHPLLYMGIWSGSCGLRLNTYHSLKLVEHLTKPARRVDPILAQEFFWDPAPLNKKMLEEFMNQTYSSSDAAAINRLATLDNSYLTTDATTLIALSRDRSNWFANLIVKLLSELMGKLPTGEVNHESLGKITVSDLIKLGSTWATIVGDEIRNSN